MFRNNNYSFYDKIIIHLIIVYIKKIKYQIYKIKNIYRVNRIIFNYNVFITKKKIKNSRNLILMKIFIIQTKLKLIISITKIYITRKITNILKKIKQIFFIILIFFLLKLKKRINIVIINQILFQIINFINIYDYII